MLNESDVMRRKARALGKTVRPRQDDLKDLEHFLCALYGDNERLSVNQTRYNMYCKSQSLLQSHQLSPIESALLHHFNRANYQTHIWKNALQATIPMQEPAGEDWKVKDGHLGILWTAPDGCSCLKIELPCTEACSCQEDCVNSANDHFGDDSGDSSENSDKDD